jgi:hypothetical protein
VSGARACVARGPSATHSATGRRPLTSVTGARARASAILRSPPPTRSATRLVRLACHHPTSPPPPHVTTTLLRKFRRARARGARLAHLRARACGEKGKENAIGKFATGTRSRSRNPPGVRHDLCVRGCSRAAKKREVSVRGLGWRVGDAAREG